MAEEALTCFNCLLGIVPGLIDELDGILKNSKDRQRHELAKNQPARKSGHATKERSRSSSLQSRSTAEKRVLSTAPQPRKGTHTQYEQTPTPHLHGADQPPILLQALEDAPPAVQEQPPHLTDADALRLAQRKRKTASACSDRHSGLLKYRSKHLVVVYYDGDVQNRFEAVVRRIGMCRNSMRRGKMSAKVDSFARAGSSSSDDSQDEGLGGVMKIKGYMPTLRQPRILPRNDGSQAFDKADGFLDKAQALCERAAHQILRDGDCAAEVKTAKENILAAQRVGEAELPALRKRADKAAEARRKEEAEEGQRRKEAEAGVEEEQLGGAGDDDNALVHVDSRLASPVMLEVDELEVDSSDDDSDPLDTLRQTMQFGKFSARTTATFNRYMTAT